MSGIQPKQVRLCNFTGMLRPNKGIASISVAKLEHFWAYVPAEKGRVNKLD